MTRRRERAAHVLFAAALLLTGLAVVLPAAPTEARAAATGSAVTRSVTATREHVAEDGTTTQVSSKRVTLKVSQTANLRGRQEVHVSWSGATPTGAVAPDPNASDARLQEYPFVLLECRGVDTTGAVPQGQSRLSPETCWTQTSAERYLEAASHTPSWRFDEYAAPADRGAVVGAPDPLPAACAALGTPITARWLPLKSSDGTTYYGGPDPDAGCATSAPESDDAESGGLPSNTTYGVTGTDGTGSADFAVWTGAENGTLGCTAAVRCALVAVPIVGVSCDAWGKRLPAGTAQTTRAGVPLTATQKASADATCSKTGAYQPGETRGSQLTDQAVRGNLWWSPSNWRNRITVPLDFAVTGAVCDAVSKDAPVEMLGSTVLNELTASWRPTFCTTSSLFPFNHVQQADSLARLLVTTGEVDAAFGSTPQAGGFSRPVVQAPVAFSGFAIAFTIDDASGRRRETLNLDARLVAKLLTESYPAFPVVRDNHPSIGANPYNITLDPEFQALNPGVAPDSNLQSAAALQIVSANSDLLWALTSWIQNDPEARTWLNGYADPWGMTVNEKYRGIELPVETWPLLDDFVAPQAYRDQNACYDNSPTPFMQLVANPLSSLGAVVFNLQFASSAVNTVCRYDGYDPTTKPLRQQGRQNVGHRFVLGLVPLSAAKRYNLRTAALQTVSTGSPRSPFSTPAGRTFVSPTTDALRAATALLTPLSSAGTWALDYPALHTDAGRSAYPGALPVYAIIPTTGLASATAKRMATFLCYASGPGQVSGDANGTLPAGYLPIRQDNGLGAEHDYVLSAAVAVRQQAGKVPVLGAAAPTRDAACRPTTASTPPSSSAPSSAPPSTTGSTPAAPVVPVVPVASVPSASVPVAPSTSAAAPVAEAATVLTAGQQSTLGRMGVPGLLVVAFLCALAGSLIRWYDALALGLAHAGPVARRLAARARPPRRPRGGRRA